jgi:stage III sporulation protein AB
VLGVVCALTGQYIAYRLNMRVKLLEKLQVMLCIIESEIRYLCRPGDEIISELAENKDLNGLTFLKSCDSLMKGGTDFKNAWEISVSDRNNVRYLEKDDVTMLRSFGGLFGVSDSTGQISNCQLHSELLKSKLNDAREKRDRYASLSCGLGLMAGIGVIIIFI